MLAQPLLAEVRRRLSRRRPLAAPTGPANVRVLLGVRASYPDVPEGKYVAAMVTATEAGQDPGTFPLKADPAQNTRMFARGCSLHLKITPHDGQGPVEADMQWPSVQAKPLELKILNVARTRPSSGSAPETTTKKPAPAGWPACLKRRLTTADYEGKTYEEVRDMINWLSAAGRQEFHDARIGRKFRDLGFTPEPGRTEPDFSGHPDWKANYEALSNYRDTLRTQAPHG